MKLGPRIIASEAVHEMADINGVWKIAAVEGRIGWHWLCGWEAGEQINKAMYNEGTRPRTISAVTGRQMWDGAERFVLFVRLLPAGAKP